MNPNPPRTDRCSSDAASAKVRCPACSVERSLTAVVSFCDEHGLALIEPRLLAAPDAMLGRTLAERYVVLERIASGATSAVYRARDRQADVDVALKIVPAKSPLFGETRQRFARETEAMQVLESAHTVRVLDSGETSDGACFLAMELLVGETLGARLKRGALEPALAVRVLEGALRSLAEAHDKGIIHRDLKPENLFLVSDLPGRPDFCKVLDFGIAKLKGDGSLRPGLTERGTVLGTPRYMSPEQAQGAEVDERSDLYSLGVILFQMLTGVPPFVAPDPVMVMAKHVRELPPNPLEAAPHLSSTPKLVALVRKLLSKSPEDRSRSAADLLGQLEGVRRELGLLAYGVTTSNGVALERTASRRRNTNLTSYVALGGACLAFIALGWMAKLSSSGQKAETRGAALAKIGAELTPRADLASEAAADRGPNMVEVPAQVDAHLRTQVDSVPVDSVPAVASTAPSAAPKPRATAASGSRSAEQAPSAGAPAEVSGLPAPSPGANPRPAGPGAPASSAAAGARSMAGSLPLGTLSERN